MSDLVARFGTSAERLNLLVNLITYRAQISALGYVAGMQFVNGSFVQDVETLENRPPNDIDVFSFLIRPAKYQSDPQQWQTTGFVEWNNVIANRALNKSRYSLDTYAIAVDQTGLSDLITNTIYWYSLFSHKRATHDWKGFVQITLDPADDQTAHTAIVSGP